MRTETVVAVAPTFLKLFVADLDRSIAFYRRCFGFEEARRFAAPGFDEVVLGSGTGRSASVILCRWHDGRSLDLGNAHGPIGFFVEDVDAAYAAAVAAGAATRVAPRHVGASRIAILLDPDGHPIVLMRPTARLASAAS